MARVGDGLHILSALAVGEEVDLGLGPSQPPRCERKKRVGFCTESGYPLFCWVIFLLFPSSIALAPGFPDKPLPEQPSILIPPQMIPSAGLGYLTGTGCNEAIQLLLACRPGPSPCQPPGT